MSDQRPAILPWSWCAGWFHPSDNCGRKLSKAFSPARRAPCPSSSSRRSAAGRSSRRAWTFLRAHARMRAILARTLYAWSWLKS